jgi:hypothetical protein
MKLPHGYGICVCCGRRYRLCRFNGHNQEYCDRPECQLERKRKRDRERYRRKYHAGDTAFCNREKARRSVARRRKATVPVPVPAPALTSLPVPALACEVERLSWVVAGVVRAFSGESDPVSIRELTSTFEAAGRRLVGCPGAG